MKEEKSVLLVRQENLELRKENEALKETLTKLLVELERVRGLPAAPTNPNRIVLTTEQVIIEDQIQKLNQLSLGGSLSLDEIRALDLLIKNKKVLEKNTTIEPEYQAVTKDTPEKELLKLAGSSEDGKFKRRSQQKTSTENPVE